MRTSGGWAVGLGLFAALSAADFVQTYALVHDGHGYEANPVAAAWLARHGWAGLAAFKGLAALSVVGCVLLLVRLRPAVAARVLGLGCGVLLAVGVYSRGLLTAPPADEAIPDGRVILLLPADPAWSTPRRAPPPAPAGAATPVAGRTGQTWTTASPWAAATASNT